MKISSLAKNNCYKNQPAIIQAGNNTARMLSVFNQWDSNSDPRQ